MSKSKKVSFSRAYIIEAELARQRIWEAINLIVAAVNTTGIRPTVVNEELFLGGYNRLLDVHDNLSKVYEQLNNILGPEPIQPIKYVTRSQSTPQKSSERKTQAISDIELSELNLDDLNFDE